MKVVILAGGLGTRLSEETVVKPKPMVEIGSRPILWHIMKYYASYGFTEFLIALGYKGELIKRYFLDYYLLNGSMSIMLDTGEVKDYHKECEAWAVDLIDTGLNTQTGGRLKRLEPWLKDDTFMLTYGDGVCDVDLHKLRDFHAKNGKMVTLTAVRPPARFGGLQLDGDTVASFDEKSQIKEGWINGGFMVMEPAVLQYIKDDATSLESDVLPQIAAKGMLIAHRHAGFWQCMDTLRDLRTLESLWQSENPPWKRWS